MHTVFGRAAECNTQPQEHGPLHAAVKLPPTTQWQRRGDALATMYGDRPLYAVCRTMGLSRTPSPVATEERPTDLSGRGKGGSVTCISDVMRFAVGRKQRRGLDHH